VVSLDLEFPFCSACAPVEDGSSVLAGIAKVTFLCFAASSLPPTEPERISP
jgi:hypothetical protein